MTQMPDPRVIVNDPVPVAPDFWKDIRGFDGMSRDPAKDDLLILVDEQDNVVGNATKAEVHRQGLLHRAFSVVLTRTGVGGRTEYLLATRAHTKYHSGGLWVNSCCSHPRVGERVREAAARRVREELGCEVADLHEVGAFVYRADVGPGLVEHEYDHVLVGCAVGEVTPNPDEVGVIEWCTADEVRYRLKRDALRFAAWAPQVLEMALAAEQ